MFMAYILTLCWSSGYVSNFTDSIPLLFHGLYRRAFTPGSTCHVEKLDYMPKWKIDHDRSRCLICP